MNRMDYARLLEDVEKELTMPNGNFDARYGHDPETIEQARYIAAVALVAADRYYSQLTLQDFELRSRDEHACAAENKEIGSHGSKR